MRRFVFKLETVLEQRKQAELQCQRNQAEVQRQIVRLEMELENAVIAARTVSVPLRGRVDPRTLAAQVRFSRAMALKLAKLRVDLGASKSDLAIVQAALVAASKDRKVLEKLQERQKQRWAQEQQRCQCAAEDDLSQRLTHEQGHSTGTFPATGP